MKPKADVPVVVRNKVSGPSTPNVPNRTPPTSKKVKQEKVLVDGVLVDPKKASRFKRRKASNTSIVRTPRQAV